MCLKMTTFADADNGDNGSDFVKNNNGSGNRGGDVQ